MLISLGLHCPLYLLWFLENLHQDTTRQRLRYSTSISDSSRRYYLLKLRPLTLSHFSSISPNGGHLGSSFGETHEGYSGPYIFPFLSRLNTESTVGIGMTRLLKIFWIDKQNSD